MMKQLAAQFAIVDTGGWVKAILFIAVLASLLGCGQSDQPVFVDFTKTADVVFQEDPTAITYAYLPQYAHRISYERHHPLIEYLIQETGLPIRQVFPDNFEEHMDMVGLQQIDLSFSNPLIYCKISHRYQARAFARVVEIYGKERFRGQIICRADNSQIRSIENCRGKRWIAVDPSSAGGYLYALGTFLEYGIRSKDFAEIAFAPGPGGKQEKVVLAVNSGRYDVGSIREWTLDVVADKIDVNQIRVLACTPWHPGWVFAARAGLDPQIVAAVQRALLNLDCTNPEGRKICEAARFIKVIPAEDQDFDSVRELTAKIGLDLNQ